MRAWFAYAVVGLLVVLVAGIVATLVVAPSAVAGVWFAAGLAYVLQLVAFGVLVAVRGQHSLFMVGWLAGLVLRFLGVGVVAFWLLRDPVFPREPTLVSLVAFVFVLLLLEPAFLRRGLQTR